MHNLRKLSDIRVRVNSLCRDSNLDIESRKKASLTKQEHEIQTSLTNVKNFTDWSDIVFSYYEDTDNLAVYFIIATPGVIDYCENASDDILVSYDRSGKIVSVDVDGVSKILQCHVFDVNEEVDGKSPLTLDPIYYEDSDTLKVYFIDYISSTKLRNNPTYQKTDIEDIKVEVDDTRRIVCILFHNATKIIAKPISKEEREDLAKRCEEEATELEKWSDDIINSTSAFAVKTFNESSKEKVTELEKWSHNILDSAHVMDWCNKSMFEVKTFKKSSKEEEIINEIKILEIASHHSNIIRFYGVTKLQDQAHISLVFEHVDGGTLRKYLRINTMTWERQLRFAKEIASAVSWLHNNKIIHGDLNPNNILIHQQMIKLANFGCSRLQGEKMSTRHGTTLYVDPQLFIDKSYELTEKSDIYSLSWVFWELTSWSSPFDYEEKEYISISLMILNGRRETPIPNTNSKFIALYEKCWQYDPQRRPDISEVISELNNIPSSSSEFSNILSSSSEFSNILSSSSEFSESKTIENSEDEDYDRAIDMDCDINNYNI